MCRNPLIIGGGPAGAAAAITLGRAGYRPIVLERTTGPTDKVCGDFLSADSIQLAKSLGVDPNALGGAPINHLRLIHGSRVTEIALPFAAMGLSRRTLDAALLDRARAAGGSVRLGQNVRLIDRTDNGWLAQIANTNPIAATDVFLATGKHDIRTRPRPGTPEGSVGMKMYYQLLPDQTAALSGAITLILFPGGYAGLQRVEGDRAVVCVATQRKRFQDAGGNWPGLLAAIHATTPHLSDVLRGATALLPRPLAVAGIPYGLLHHPERGNPAFANELFRLGDQAAVIPSLTGDGIAIAMHSGIRAARIWLEGKHARTYHGVLSADIDGQMRLAKLMHAASMFGPFQSPVVRCAGWFPGLVQRAASATRIKKS